MKREPAAPSLTVYPAGTIRPLASNLNWNPGQTFPNRAVVPLGSGGQVVIYNHGGGVDVIADVDGWFTDGSDAGASGGSFTPINL